MPTLYPALTTLLSIASGLLGYRHAVSVDPSGLRDYLLALGTGGMLQVPVAALVSNRRDRFARIGQPHRHVNVRLAACLHLLVGLTVLLAVAHAFVQRPVTGHLTLVLLGAALQYGTYGPASREQVRNLSGYWRRQCVGACVRAAGVGALVVLLDLAYTGILLANIAAAAAIGAAYGRATWRWPVGGRRLARAWRRARARFWTPDGMLRAAKSSFEPLAINATALCLERAAGWSMSASQALLASVGYLSTLAVALRQIGAGWEREVGRAPAPVMLSLAGAAVGIAAVGLQHGWGLFDPLLPRLGTEARLQIVAACGSWLVAHPATRGFLYLDYRPPGDVRRVALALALLQPMAVLLAIAAARVIGDPAVPVVVLATPFAVALALRLNHA